jgi:hypothetical protein
MGGFSGMMGGSMGGVAGSMGGGGGKKKSKSSSPSKKFQPMSTEEIQASAPPSFHRGGKVRKTGVIKVKRGERILTAKQDRAYSSKTRTGKAKYAKKRIISK